MSYLTAFLHPLSWPLSARVPAVVVGLMVAVSVLISERVLTRLIEIQNRHLSELTGAYLDGVSSGIMPHVIREDVWETYDVLDRAASQYKGLDVVWTTVTDPSGSVLASSEPRRHAIQSVFPGDLRAGFEASSEVLIDEQLSVSRFKRVLEHQGRHVGTIYGEVRIGRLIGERWDILIALLLTNTFLTVLLAAVGYITIRRMIRPVALLTEHLRKGAAAHVAEIPTDKLGSSKSEFGQLFGHYNSLVAAVSERERLLHTLAEEERLAALGRLASGMAHEINNPLGGMLNAVATLKRHGSRDEVRQHSVSLIERGLLGIRDVVRSTLATYRTRPGR